MKDFYKIIPLLLVLVVFSGCKTGKSISSKTPEKAVSILDVNHSFTPAEMAIQIQKNQPAFTTAKVGKMSIKVDFKDRQLDVKATCNIVSDSTIHLSIQPFFGVELFKLELTPNTLILIDKPNKRFYESNYGFFRERFGITVNYDAIQSLISNRLFVAGKKAFSPNDFHWKKNVPKDMLAVQFETMYQETWLNLPLARISEVVLRTNDEAYEMKTLYADFKDFGGTLFPAKIYMDANSGKSAASFHFTIDDVKFDIPLTLEPTSLSRYVRGDINAFFKK